jgi:L-serine kinase (ATP) / ParB family transcriptional regulator, heme-responsive regulator
MSQFDFRMPDLKFVPTEDIYPHELHDLQRTEPLVERLRASGMLRNPPIVTQLGDGMRVEPRYVVLDGANRSTAARAAGWPHLLVQVVRYESPAVELYTWYHALTADARDLLESGLSSLPGLKTSRHDHVHARALLARREALACVVLGEDEAIVAHGGRNLHERNELLNALVHLYQDRLPYTRVTSDSLSAARREHPEVRALVVFPRFDPAEVIDLASAGEYLPAGITRHLIRWRALRVNVPIALCANLVQSLEDKNAWVQAWTAERLKKREVRFYEEPTVLYDE